MTIEIKVNNKQKMAWLVELLKSLDFVEGVKVADTPKKTTSFVDKYHGCSPNLDVAAIDKYITETRNEWERNIY
jgi:hypothetical protein